MKNINYVINGVLAVAVVILYIMQFSGKKESSVTRTFASAGDTTALLPIAYVNVDSLLLNYNYSKDLNEIILKKQENSRANITQKARSLQGEMQDFQRKVENNAFLTRERAEQEQQRLLNKQQELQNLDNQLAQELMQEQQSIASCPLTTGTTSYPLSCKNKICGFNKSISSSAQSTLSFFAAICLPSLFTKISIILHITTDYRDVSYIG